MTTLEQNKQLVRHAITAGVNGADLDVFREVLHPDYARHSQATTDMPEIRGVEQMLEFLRTTFATFPDWHEDVQLMIAEGPYVACVTRGTGTQKGAMGDVPPTGKTIDVMNFIFHRIADGKIAETWIGWDNLAAMAQLGLLPTPNPDGPA